MKREILLRQEAVRGYNFINMDDQIITFQTFDNPIQAHIIRSRLESNNIPCFLADEHIIGLNPLYNPAIGGVKLKIFEKDYEKCIALLSEDEDIEPVISPINESEATFCPNCNSANVGYGNATKKRFGWFTIIISFVFMVYPFHSRKVWHCYNCEHEFS